MYESSSCSKSLPIFWFYQSLILVIVMGHSDILSTFYVFMDNLYIFLWAVSPQIICLLKKIKPFLFLVFNFKSSLTDIYFNKYFLLVCGLPIYIPSGLDFGFCEQNCLILMESSWSPLLLKMIAFCILTVLLLPRSHADILLMLLSKSFIVLAFT